MKKLKLFILLVGVFFISFGNSNAQKVRSQLKDNNKVYDQLNLTDNQKESFTKIRFESEKKQIDLEAQLKLNRLEIKKLISEANFEENQLLDLVKNSNKITNEMKLTNVDKWLKIRNILDDDQKKVWKKRFNKMVSGKNMFIGKEKRKKVRQAKKHHFQQMSKKNRIDDNNLED